MPEIQCELTQSTEGKRFSRRRTGLSTEGMKIFIK